MLNPQEAEAVASLMAAVDGDEDIDLDQKMKRAPRVAAAAVLLLRVSDWLADNVATQQRAQSIIDAAITIPNGSDARGSRMLMAPSYLEFAGCFVVERWIAEPSHDERVMRLLTSGDGKRCKSLSGGIPEPRNAWPAMVATSLPCAARVRSFDAHPTL